MFIRQKRRQQARMAWRTMLSLTVALSLSAAPSDGQPLQSGEVFVGQFELPFSTAQGDFELRVHSPVTGQATWLTEALGPNAGWMSSCHTASVDDPSARCAGGPLEKPVFGYLNYSSLGVCTGSNACSGPPYEQASTGCVPYGCWTSACGCDARSGDGCWGKDMRGALALIQRGSGVGEPAVRTCTFTLKLHNAQLAGARAAIVYNNNGYGGTYMARGPDVC
jgi:hypothetical protein